MSEVVREAGEGRARDGAGDRRSAALVTPVPTAGYALALEEGVPGRDPEVKCSLASTGGSLALYRTVVDGEGPPPHRHTHEDETIVVLDGLIEAACGDDVLRGGPGATLFLPRGLTHSFRSVDGPATILFIVTPGHLDEFFRLKDLATEPAEVGALVRDFL
jgi:quercetin dioxygenase-like cupin family protein